MKIREISTEDLELLSYTDIAYQIIKQDKKAYNTPKLFEEICKLLKIEEKEMKEKIGDFYTSLTIDKRFLLLDSLEWDLKENHKVKVIVEEDLEDIIEEAEDSEDDLKEEDEIEGDDSHLNDIDENIDEEVDAFEDLSIISEEDLEE